MFRARIRSNSTSDKASTFLECGFGGDSCFGGRGFFSVADGDGMIGVGGDSTVAAAVTVFAAAALIFDRAFGGGLGRAFGDVAFTVVAAGGVLFSAGGGFAGAVGFTVGAAGGVLLRAFMGGFFWGDLPFSLGITACLRSRGPPHLGVVVAAAAAAASSAFFLVAVAVADVDGGRGAATAGVGGGGGAFFVFLPQSREQPCVVGLLSSFGCPFPLVGVARSPSGRGTSLGYAYRGTSLGTLIVC